MDLAFMYCQQYSLETEANYPYTSGTGKVGTCQYSASKASGVKAASHTDVQHRSQTALMTALAGQPVSVAIEADKLVFQQYRTGVLSSSACGTQLDHGVLAVGYGTENGTPYYLVKNSWGTGWGDKGYIKLANNSPNGAGQCGIQLGAVYATAA